MIFEHWNLIQADFWREYRIDLAKEYYTLSWRRFMMLLSGLSKDSSFVISIVHSDPNAPIEDNPMEIAGNIARQRKKAKRG